jgi:protein disulfide-isomerase
MRLAFVAGWLLAFCALPVFATPPAREGDATVSAGEAVTGETPAKDSEAVEYTIFNGVEVPPMIEIEGDKFAETVKDGYWYVGGFCTC